jgi:hypothetical protein
MGLCLGADFLQKAIEDFGFLFTIRSAGGII